MPGGARLGRKGRMGKPVKIINLVGKVFQDHPGGVGRLAADLARKQAQWGYQAFLLGEKYSPDSLPSEEVDGYTVIRTHRSKHPSPDPRNLIGSIVAARNATTEISNRIGGVDVIHTHVPAQGLGAMLAAPDAYCVHSIPSPWMMEIRSQKLWAGRGNVFQRLRLTGAYGMASVIESACFSRADLLTGDSGFTREVILKDHPRIGSRKPFEVFPGWVDVERFGPDGPGVNWEDALNRPPIGPVFLTVRTLMPRYGLEMLIEAAKMVRDRGHDCEVVIGGGGELMGALRQKIGELSLDDRVTLLGWLDEDRLPDYYRACDVFVLPTIALECFGLIILEALASAKPVIATPVAAIPELMKPTYPEGLLSEVSAEALGDSMIEHLCSKEFRKPGAGSADDIRDIICERYSIESGTARFREAYEAATGG